MLPHEGGDVVNATPFDGIETARLKGISQFQYRKHDERVFPQLIKPLANFDTIASEKRFINISETTEAVRDLSNDFDNLMNRFQNTKVTSKIGNLTFLEKFH